MIRKETITDGIDLYLGDCRDVLPALPVADVCVTDPPYGIEWAAGRLHFNRMVRSTASPSIIGDGDTTVRDTVLCIWGSRPSVVFGTWRQSRPERTGHRLIWHKASKKPGVSPHPWFLADEEIYLLGGGWQGPPRGSVITTHEMREREPGRWGHPTPKPISLMETLIEKCPPGVIADPFAGSGSTLVAARNLGRRAIGVEIEERYCEIIAARLAQDCLDLAGV